jgi:hypothetical protein
VRCSVCQTELLGVPAASFLCSSIPCGAVVLCIHPALSRCVPVAVLGRQNQHRSLGQDLSGTVNVRAWVLLTYQQAAGRVDPRTACMIVPRLLHWFRPCLRSQKSNILHSRAFGRTRVLVPFVVGHLPPWQLRLQQEGGAVAPGQHTVTIFKHLCLH